MIARIMSKKEHTDPDFYAPSRRHRNKWSINPRVLFIDNDGGIPLLPHKGRLGLFGGHMKVREVMATEGLNLLDSARAFPTLDREVNEEAKRDMSEYLEKMTCLGITEINILDLTKRRLRMTQMISPIYICHTPTIVYENHIEMARINKLPKNLYPDAALALWHIRRNLQRHTKGAIFPAWLNHGRYVVFAKAEPESFVKFFHQ